MAASFAAASALISEISLAENVVRVPMHPADQFEAFRTVIENGSSIADVAARFGVSEDIVEKRLKLGRFSPAILKAYRAEEIGLEQAQASPARSWEWIETQRRGEIPLSRRSPALTDYPQTPRSAGH
jgi:ParB family chromosome partitioning protein